MEKKVHELDLHGKKLTALKDLDKFGALRVLDASCNNLTKIEGLDRNKGLRELKLYGNQITNIEGLDKLTELSSLLLHFNKITAIGKGLQHCHRLCVLRLNGNVLEELSIADLSACRCSLSHLDLSDNCLSSVEGLKTLVNIQELNLARNKLGRVPDFSQCKKLTELNLSGNSLETASLSHLNIPQLKVLYLDWVTLPSSCLSRLPPLPHLLELHVAHCSLTNLTHCPALFPALESLDTQENQLENVEALRPLAALGALAEIQLEGNPLCSTSSDYRRQVQSVIPDIEMIDGVCAAGLITDIASGSKSVVPLMRPLTPGTIGPSLTQVERHLLEAQVQLENLSSEITAKFELLRQE